jgi:2-polyprenyl-6-hydroxyphenyl methylase/3-demethylubiquinone-9 3-methyltransferase
MFFSKQALLGVGVVLGSIGLANLLRRSEKNDLSIYNTADWWNPDSSFGILARMNKVRVPYFLKFLPKTGLIIDLGCGGGLVTETIALTSECKVVGFDISEGALDKARLHAEQSSIPKSKLEYRKGSIYEIPMPDQSVDGVIVSDVLEHLHDIPAAMNEISRVLKPGGVVVFDTIARTWWSWLSTYFVAQEVLGIVERDAHDWSMFINPGELERMLNASGFNTNASEWTGICAVVSPLNAIKKKSLFHLIESFYESESDLRASYLGYAVKPLSQ